ncbi:MAG: hypothetical protein FJW30_04370 [Acidobacteria bacterium]|nr:hypothetical protein [Acidobacteriota bacterium]
MPFRTIPGTAVRYGLLSYGADGRERTDDPDGLMTRQLLDVLAAEPITNVFLFSHGWMGDVPAAVRQYDLWIGALARHRTNWEAAERKIPGFRPLFIGLHWPSLPWGDEDLDDVASFSDAEDPFAGFTSLYGEDPEVALALAALRRARDLESAGAAFTALERAMDVRPESFGGGPSEKPVVELSGDDEDGEEDIDFAGGGLREKILDGLRLLSFFKMKNRARAIGEGAMNAFAGALQSATQARIHLMGHSFGCVVVSSILNGDALRRPIDSVALVQGAVSLWSYSPSIPIAGAGAGVFHRVITERRVRGPVVTTHSKHDTAVGIQYPRVSRGVAFDDGESLPNHGAIGSFGLQGLPHDTVTDMKMLPANVDYRFQPGRVYNLDASAYVRAMDGPSGAHNDIGGPEVAHAIWQAALVD